MNILITGSMGNIGTSTLTALQGRGHRITCFDLHTPVNRKLAKRLPSDVRMCWGDIRQAADIASAVANQEVVVHLAAIIPELSHTGERSEVKPDAAYQVNVGGMKNLIAALQAMPEPASIFFTSTLHVYGLTHTSRRRAVCMTRCNRWSITPSKKWHVKPCCVNRVCAGPCCDWVRRYL